MKMQWTKPSALFVAALLLAGGGACVAAEAVKAPLTAAERAQCRAQVETFNENVRAHNAKADAVRTLEAEVDALSADIDKESAAVDRRDRAAMDALNAKIGRSNDLVARHEIMMASLKTSADDVKQRAEAFKEACEGRAPVQAAAPETPALQPAPADAACGSATGHKEVERRLEGLTTEMRADEKRHQAEVDKVAEAQARAKGWNADKKGKVWMQILLSPRSKAFEREKEPISRELISMLGSKPKSGQDECRLLQRLATILQAIKAINARQYAFMADEIRKAK